MCNGISNETDKDFGLAAFGTLKTQADTNQKNQITSPEAMN
jgi:hypothetical protein